MIWLLTLLMHSERKKSSILGDLLGDWTAILSGHASYAKVKPFAGQGLHPHSLVNTLSIVQIKKNVRNKKDVFQSVFF